MLKQKTASLSGAVFLLLVCLCTKENEIDSIFDGAAAAFLSVEFEVV